MNLAAMSFNILETLYVAYHGEKSDRTAATEQLTKVMSTSSDAPLYLLQLLEAGVDGSIPTEQSLSALLYAKNSLLFLMPDQLLEEHPDVLERVEEKLFQGMFQVPESHRKVLKECIATLVSGFAWDYLEEVIPMVVSITEHAASNGASLPPLEHAKALLQLLYTYLKRFKTPNLVSASIKMRVLLALLPVMPYYVSLYHDFFLSRYTFKVMECLIEAVLRMDTAAERKQLKGPLLDPWWQLMAQFMSMHLVQDGSVNNAGSVNFTNIPQDPSTATVNLQFVLCVKRIAMITYSVLNDATRRKKPVPIALHFMKSGTAEHFMQRWQSWLQFCIAASGRMTPGHDSSGRMDPQLLMKSELFAIRFIKLCTLDQQLYLEHILPHAIPLMERLLLPYLYYNEEDEEVFGTAEDLPEYTQYMLSESVGMGELSPRQAASNAILSFIGGKKAFHAGPQLLDPLLQALASELSLENTPENMPRLFGALHLLSVLRKHLRSNTAVWSQQMHVVLAQQVAPRMTPAMPLVAVRSKAITVCQRYAKVPMPSEEVFASFVQMMCQCLQDEDPRIRLSGIDAVCTLLEMKRARVYLTPFLVPVVEQCMEFLNKVQTTFVPTVILHVATHFAPEIAGVMDKLGSALVQQFLATAFDLESMEDVMTGDDGKALEQYEAAAFSADSILRALDTVLSSCENNLPAVERLRPDLVRLIGQVLRHPNAFEYLEQTLVIFLHLVHFTSPITQDLWDLLPLLFQSVEQGTGIDVFNCIEEVLDNFISGAPVVYIQNPELMDLTLQCCEKMLLGGVVTSSECVCAAPQLMEALIHQAKGPQCPPGILTPHLPRIWNILLQTLLQTAVQSAEDVPGRIWVLAATMDCFYYDAELSLRTLVEQNAAEAFFHGFFQLFRGALPELMGPADAAGGSAPEAKKGGKRKKQKWNEAQEVVERLSLLTRKVIILGISSLLSFVADVQAAKQQGQGTHLPEALLAFHDVFVSSFTPLAVGLLEYCVLENHALYVKRCEIAKHSIERLERGDDEDDVEDVDPDDEAILGIDGADDTGAGAALDGGDEANELLSEAEDVQDDDDALSLGDCNDVIGDMFGFEPDEGDDYESPIDDINEVQFFAEHWLHKALLPLDPLKMETLQRCAGVAGEYRQLCIALEDRMKQRFTERQQGAEPRSG